jgi:hypothetical protein
VIAKYVDIAVKFLPIVLILAVGGYVWYLHSQLNTALTKVTNLTTELTNVRETVGNLRERVNIEDTVRQLPDPAGVLRDRFSRPSQ